jgi:hypothetical protein
MVAILSFPIMQDIMHILHPIQLKGAITEPVYKKFTWQSWWSGTYQDTMGEYAKGKTGLRPYLTRLVNQIDYTLYDKTHANSVVKGLNGFLYEDFYIHNYSGRDIMPYDWWLAKIYKLKMVQDTLSKIGVTLISIHAPSKAAFFPEYFPVGEKCIANPVNNHELFDRIGDSLGVNIIDFNHWFVSLKGKTEGHLFTKQGIHWSLYGATIAADSFERYLKFTVGLNLPDMKWDKGSPVLSPRQTDIDIFEGLNLMQEPDKDTFYYPSIWYEGTGRDNPKMTYIADSFMWTWMFEYIPHNISTDWEFWYCNTEVWNKRYDCIKMENHDWVARMLASRCIVLLYSDGNPSNYGSGFIEKAYEHFYVKQ